MKNAKIYRTKLSFNKNELVSSIVLEHAGVNLLLPLTGLDKVREQFGLFGSGNNSNTFFPSLDVQNDVVPKPEDFIDVPFRLLSETIVAAGTWRSTDFSKDGVLKASIDKLVSKPVFHDHDTELANWLGIVTATKWTPSFVDTKGVKIPAGIDGMLSIDAKSNPKFARGVMLGAIFSNSVTVDFGWEMSHPFKDVQEFESKVGSMGTDGKMITRRATVIYDYYETSLVWLGADPYSKLIGKNGDLVNVDHGAAVEFSKEEEKTQKLYLENKKYLANACLTKDSVISLRQRLVSSETQVTETPMEKELLALLKIILNLDDKVELTKDHLAELKLVKYGSEVVESATLTALKADASKVEGLTSKVTETEGKVTSLFTEVETLKADKIALEPFATAGKAYETAKRAELTRLYKLSVGAGKEDQAVLDLHAKADMSALDGLITQLTNGVVQKFKGHCKSCNSTEISFKSSFSEADLEKDTNVSPNSVSREHLHTTFKKQSK